MAAGRPPRLSDDTVFFPGLPDHDAVDEAARAWAASRDYVLAVARCWGQPTDDDDVRVRIYGVLVANDDVVAPIRAECAEVVRRAGGGEVAIEVVVPSEELPDRQRRLFDHAVVLWELGGDQDEPGATT